MKQWLEPFVRFSKLWNKCRVRLLQMDQFLFLTLKEVVIRLADALWHANILTRPFHSY